jgi:two-component system LytT family response regulator
MEIIINPFLQENKKKYQYKTFLVILLFWSVNCFLAWLYLCKIDYRCSPTRLVTGYLAGIVFWFVFSPFVIKGVLKIKKMNTGLLKKSTILFTAGLFLIISNQFFVYKVIELVYQLVWSYSEPNPSWVNEVITNNVLINIFFFCLLCQTVWTGSEPNTQAVKPATDTYQDKILIKDGSTSQLVPVETIRFIQVEQNCIHIHTSAKKYILYSSLVNFSKNLSPDIFIKVHRSAIINKQRVQQVRNLPSGDAEVLLQCGTVLKCSRVYKKHLSAHIN